MVRSAPSCGVDGKREQQCGGDNGERHSRSGEAPLRRGEQHQTRGAERGRGEQEGEGEAGAASYPLEVQIQSEESS